jgi:hypothetical protein
MGLDRLGWLDADVMRRRVLQLVTPATERAEGPEVGLELRTHCLLDRIVATLRGGTQSLLG